MATAPITIKSTVWTEIGDATEQVILTPNNPFMTILIRYATTLPAPTVLTGHKFFVKDDVPNALAGSANTEKIWARLTKGSDEIIEVSVV